MLGCYAHGSLMATLACSLLKPMGDADMAINVVEYDSNWERLAGTEFTMQHSFFNPHDFAITPNNYIFFQVQRSSGLAFVCRLCSY